MATESSRSCQSRSSAQKRELVCRHGERPVLRVSGTRNNPGRRFWGCVYYEIQEECDIFRWVDPETDSDDPHVARMKRKVAAMKAKVRDNEWKFKVAAVLGIFGFAMSLSFLGETGSGILWLKETVLAGGYSWLHPSPLVLVVAVCCFWWALAWAFGGEYLLVDCCDEALELVMGLLDEGFLPPLVLFLAD
ncbi:uncharacterized protein LOC130981305 [Arachis stenosperma]|uniref:uncharacterized protein LOC130981305 n=1 Tax=Arachis stenosperma TaxID=217475 RepID=UPI0025AB9503|nr:uncharacterized protein LOC130981305 [Arachis stenosperma]